MGKHQKHTALEKASLGHFGRNELAILGTPCGNIKQLSREVIQLLGDAYAISYVDADHKSADDHSNTDNVVLNGGSKLMTDKIDYLEMDWHGSKNPFQQKKWHQDQDLVLINGNHFEAKDQIVVVDSAKPLEKKLSKLTNVVLVLIKDGSMVPEYLEEYISDTPTFPFDDNSQIIEWIGNYLAKAIPEVYGLVLAGGKSVRMKQDKGLIAYHGLPQREHIFQLLNDICSQTFVSCRDDQASEIDNPLPDSFVGLGPFGGILSAFRKHPNVAWLTVASDLPLVDEDLLSQLLQNRNPSKVATAFWDPNHEFPEPLITIWEPRAYPELLHFLSLGYSCPRKVLINSDVEVIESSDTRKLMNVNYPEELDQVLQQIKTS